MRFLLILLPGLFIYGSSGQTLNIDQFASGFIQPVDIAHAGGDELYIVERAGRIFVLDESGNTLPGHFLNITDRVNSSASERGLLGLVFHPQYPDSSYIYCNYTGPGGATRISRFTVNSNTSADSTSEVILLSYAQPFTNHNGGDLDFDDNGYLLIASGDGGSGGDPMNLAQNLNSLLGKILRIDVDNGNPYSIPNTNPFVGQPNVREEIWAYGLRNPWRIDFDQINQALYVGDVGQNNWEEIDEIDVGLPDPNFGWRCYEGSNDFNLDSCEGVITIDPIHEYPHVGGGCSGSITGGKLYRGFDMPAFYGKYFYADYCEGFIAALDPQTLQNDTLFGPSSLRLTTFGEDAQGGLYVGERNSGIIYKLSSEPQEHFIFTINLNGAQSGTPSGAIGYGIATLDTTTNILTASGKFSELIGNVTVAHVHRAPAGMNGGVVFPLTITDYGTDSIGFFGSGSLTENELNDLLTFDGLYVNIHSSAHPTGEIRGQIVRTDCPGFYSIQAPLIPEGVYILKSAAMLGDITNDRDAIVKYNQDVTLDPGFKVDLGATMEIIWEICGP